MTGPTPRQSPSPTTAGLSGRQVIGVGLIGGVVGLLLGLLLRTLVARTPVQLPSGALFWLVLVLSAMGALAAMAVEAVRQLQVSNPDPEYHAAQARHRRLAQERRQRRRAGRGPR